MKDPIVGNVKGVVICKNGKELRFFVEKLNEKEPFVLFVMERKL